MGETGIQWPGLAVFIRTISQENCWTCHFALPMQEQAKVFLKSEKQNDFTLTKQILQVKNDFLVKIIFINPLSSQICFTITDVITIQEIDDYGTKIKQRR